MDTAKAATAYGIQRRRALQSLSARSSNERLLVRRSCHKLLACETLDCRKCLFSFASCGLVYSISSLIGKIKTTAICVPTSCDRNRHHGVACGLSRPLSGSRPLKYELFLDRGEISSARRLVAWSSSVLFRESASVKRFAGRETKPATHQQTEK